MKFIDLARAVESASRVFARDQAATTPAEVETILCKSMPRSGHHFLVVMLREYFGKDLHYCEFYTQEHCCKSIPCRKPQPGTRKNHYFMQKSHDFRLFDRASHGYKYIIQYRHPIPRTQSNFELAVRNGSHNDDERDFRRLLHKDARYFIRFYKKWIATPPSQALVLSYESLLGHRGDSLQRAVQFITGAEADRGQLDATIARMSGTHAQTGHAFEARSVGSHRYYDPQLLQKVEQKIFHACPGLDLPRYFHAPRRY